jgi:ElaB/YqjD/DUF883 family membrane-anchored ribosome-binding protein
MPQGNSHRWKHALPVTEESTSWKETAQDLAATAGQKISRTGETARDLITAYPWQTLGAALGVGVLLGWLIKRR